MAFIVFLFERLESYSSGICNRNCGRGRFGFTAMLICIPIVLISHLQVKEKGREMDWYRYAVLLWNAVSFNEGLEPSEYKSATAMALTILLLKGFECYRSEISKTNWKHPYFAHDLDHITWHWNRIFLEMLTNPTVRSLGSQNRGTK